MCGQGANDGRAKTAVKVNSVTPVNDATVKANVTVPSNANVGPQMIHVINRGTGRGFFAGGTRCGTCLNVT